MHFINLEDPAANAEFMTFSGGEPYAKVATITDHKVLIYAHIRSWDDFGFLLQLLDCLYHQDKHIFIVMPYFPGARADKNPGGNTPLTVDVNAKILARYTQNIIVFDIHSEESTRIIRKNFKFAHFMGPWDIPTQYMPGGIDYIIAPDKGAAERARRVKIAHYPEAILVECEKERDFKTGQIKGLRFPTGLGAMKPGTSLVVDDIIDGGATFNWLAEEWKKAMHPSSQLWLLASHGIFSKGIENLSSSYGRIYVTDSWFCQPSAVYPPRLHVIPLTFIVQKYLEGYTS